MKSFTFTANIQLNNKMYSVKMSWNKETDPRCLYILLALAIVCVGFTFCRLLGLDKAGGPPGKNKRKFEKQRNKILDNNF